MSAASEDRWAQRKEWENERGELEINQKTVHLPAEVCHYGKCERSSIFTYEVVECGRRFSAKKIYLCVDHADDETAFEIYRTVN